MKRKSFKQKKEDYIIGRNSGASIKYWMNKQGISADSAYNRFFRTPPTCNPIPQADLDRLWLQLNKVEQGYLMGICAHENVADYLADLVRLDARCPQERKFEYSTRNKKIL